MIGLAEISFDTAGNTGSSIKSHLFAGDADTAIGVVSDSLKVNVTNDIAVDIDKDFDTVSIFGSDAGAIDSNGSGALKVEIQNTSTLPVSDVSNGAIENTAKSVTSTTGVLLVTQLADRNRYFLQNRGSQSMFIGKAGVTTANGLELPNKSVAEFALGPAVSLHAVTASSTADARIMEFAAS